MKLDTSVKEGDLDIGPILAQISYIEYKVREADSMLGGIRSIAEPACQFDPRCAQMERTYPRDAILELSASPLLVFSPLTTVLDAMTDFFGG